MAGVAEGAASPPSLAVEWGFADCGRVAWDIYMHVLPGASAELPHAFAGRSEALAWVQQGPALRPVGSPITFAARPQAAASTTRR